MCRAFVEETVSLSLFMFKNLKLKKVIKSFVPEPISCFSDSLCLFHIYLGRIFLDVDMLHPSNKILSKICPYLDLGWIQVISLRFFWWQTVLRSDTFIFHNFLNLTILGPDMFQDFHFSFLVPLWSAEMLYSISLSILFFMFTITRSALLIRKGWSISISMFQRILSNFLGQLLVRTYITVKF